MEKWCVSKQMVEFGSIFRHSENRFKITEKMERFRVHHVGKIDIGCLVSKMKLLTSMLTMSADLNTISSKNISKISVWVCVDSDSENFP